MASLLSEDTFDLFTEIPGVPRPVLNHLFDTRIHLDPDGVAVFTFFALLILFLWFGLDTGMFTHRSGLDQNEREIALVDKHPISLPAAIVLSGTAATVVFFITHEFRALAN